MNFMAGWNLGGMWMWWLLGLVIAVVILSLIRQLLERPPRRH